MSHSWLPKAGENLFQGVKKMCVEAEAMGINLLRLSIGQPMGAALESACIVASAQILKKDQRMHEYQDNGSPGCPNFAEEFVRAHFPAGTDLGKVAFLPTTGTKPTLGPIILACGAKELREKLLVRTHTKPGYPTPKVWAGYLGVKHRSLPTNPENNFLFGPEDLFKISSRHFDRMLVMINFPHNPTGVISEKEWLRAICRCCAENGYRVINDAAYASLAWNPASTLLSEVAPEFPDLQCVEIFSASKILGNACDWRIGAIVGSPDFVADIARIKGEVDSGFNAALACGVLHAVKNDRENIEKIRHMYQKRMAVLINILQKAGMELVVEPQAGFFSLWKTPKQAFGQSIKNPEQFNQLLINYDGRIGGVGVPFPPYMRFSTCAPLEDSEFVESVKKVFRAARIEY